MLNEHVYDHRTLTVLSALEVMYKDFAEQWEIAGK
jgi:hypothetical protein